MTPRSTTPEAIISIRLATALQNKLKSLNTNPRRLTKQLKSEWAYDTVRKIFKGVSFPSQKLLTEICEKLDLDYDEMYALKEQDKLLANGYADMLLDEDDVMKKVKAYWVHLNKNDKQDILDLVAAKAKR